MKRYVWCPGLVRSGQFPPCCPAAERPRYLWSAVLCLAFATMVVALAGCVAPYAPPPLNIKPYDQKKPCPRATRAKSFGTFIGVIPTEEQKNSLYLQEMLVGYTARLDEWIDIAYRGDPFAQYRIGMSCYMGAAFQKNESEAVKWFKKSASQEQFRSGMQFAQHALGIAYLTGTGVPRNEKLGLYWLRLAGKRSRDARDDLADVERRKALGLPLIDQE